MPKGAELVGKRFGRLTVIGLNGRKNGSRCWDCLCDCGNMTVVRTHSLNMGTILSCGCLKREVASVDVTNKRFGRLVAIEPTEKRNGTSIVWKCKCDCGNYCEVALTNLQKIRTRSCGCLSREVHKEAFKVAGGIRKNYYVDGTDVLNLYNGKLRSDNTSGHVGVTRTANGKWTAKIYFKGKKYSLGTYMDIKDAAEARKIAEKNIHGNFLEWYSQEYPKQWDRVKDRYNMDE